MNRFFPLIGALLFGGLFAGLATITNQLGDLTVGDVLGIEPPSIAASIAAETVPSGALSITGPDGAVKPNEDAWLKIGGLTLDEIKTAKAAGNFDLTVFPLNGVRVHAAYDWLNDRLELMFRASDTGEHLVKLHLVRDGKLEIAAVAVTVTGKEPDPNPPVPPVPPPTPGDRWVLIISETNRPTVEHRQLLTELRTSNQFPRLWIVDPDPARADPAVAPYLSGLDADKPQIVIIAEDKDKAGVVLYRGDCPTTAAEVADLLKRHGG